MIVASFLVKDLLVDWRWGERFFMQHLVDGDPAANNGGWQRTVGTGTDAAPYFRIFNPVTQSTKHDPEGSYVRRWVRELAAVPDAFIHARWTMSPEQQRECGVCSDKTALSRSSTAHRRAIGPSRPTAQLESDMITGRAQPDPHSGLLADTQAPQ